MKLHQRFIFGGALILALRHCYLLPARGATTNANRDRGNSNG